MANMPNSNVHGANTGPTWVLSAPGGPHIGPMNLAIRICLHGWCITVIPWLLWYKCFSKWTTCNGNSCEIPTGFMVIWIHLTTGSQSMPKLQCSIEPIGTTSPSRQFGEFRWKGDATFRSFSAYPHYTLEREDQATYILPKAPFTRPVAQITQCTSLLSQNASLCNKYAHVCTFLLQNGALWDIWCIVGFVRWV